MPSPLTFTVLCAVLGLVAPLAMAPARAAPPAAMQLEVDATDLDRRIFRVRQRLPVMAGPLKLYFPQWLPGQHAASGDVTRLAGLVIRAGEQRLPWRRDPADTHAFLVDVPAGVTELQLTFEHLSPVASASGRVVMTPQMLNLQWQAVLLYPAGHDAQALPIQASLRLPAGWQAGTALRTAKVDGAVLQFEPVSLDHLVDSPVFAGRHFRRVPLEADGAARPVVLNLVADNAEVLAAATEAQFDAHRRLVQQADRLFASRHFAHYDFLLALTDEMGGIGLEHLESSENGVDLKYFEAWDKSIGARELLPHEYVHSWNGKFRRPEGLVRTDFNQPVQNTLLWLYEGQTEFWGKVLAARSGLVSPALAQDSLARVAAAIDGQAGRRWRNLQDTTADAQMAPRRDRRDWHDWQRSSGDYYLEGVLIWLDVDMLIREQSGGARSLDDFARGFFGRQDGQRGPLPYRFEDVVAALQAVQPHDWAGFLRDRLDGHGPGAPLDGLARAGWKLAWSETASGGFEAREKYSKSTDLGHSLGLTVAADGRLRSVRWEGPAFEAGLAPGMLLVAVNRRAFKPDALKAAITANKGGQAPIELLVRDGEQFRSVTMDWRGGLRYPTLERIPGSVDRLDALLAPR